VVLLFNQSFIWLQITVTDMVSIYQETKIIQKHMGKLYRNFFTKLQNELY